jgi:hypothetical protein
MRSQTHRRKKRQPDRRWMLQGEGKIQMRNNAQSKWHLLCQSLEKTSSNMLERAILSVLAIATLNFMMFMSITQSQGKH